SVFLDLLQEILMAEHSVSFFGGAKILEELWLTGHGGDFILTAGSNRVIHVREQKAMFTTRRIAACAPPKDQGEQLASVTAADGLSVGVLLVAGSIVAMTAIALVGADSLERPQTKVTHDVGEFVRETAFED